MLLRAFHRRLDAVRARLCLHVDPGKHRAVKTAIFDEPTLKVLQINVETYKNVVQLSGFVSTSAEMDKAIQVARGVKGVSSVTNDMRLR
jgi:osmotically-inducible protein OsmY